MRKKPVGKYSLGQRQRLGFAQAFMEKNPDVLILDEPLTQWIRLRWKKFTICFSSSNGMERRSFWQAIVRRISKKACDIVYEMENGNLNMIQNKTVN